jgi:hypothetical protein
MRFFKRGETADSKFIFLDSSTNEPIDIIEGTYRIVHYDEAVEVIDVPDAPLEHVAGRIGEYVVNWLIPPTVPENETYFVYATGKFDAPPPDNTITLIEDFYRVVNANFFGGGSGGGAGLTIKFTKP